MDKQDNIRNLSIIAHVDHGKSTLTDSLIAKAGIIAESNAGDARFMDGRKDEKERGITIKSAGVSLQYKHKGEDLLINLIDSPGHVDFSSEVTAALRVTDGCVVVVDCVEKVCVQTETVLRQALNERIIPMLFLNKLDRPFIELKRTSEEMQQDFRQVIESVNVIVSQQGDEKAGDSTLDPIRGNVVFGSGYQQWAFTLERFAEIWAPTFKTDAVKLKEKLWGEWRFDKKGKKWTTEEQDEDGKLMPRSFCQFIIDPIYKVINFCIEGEIEKLKKFLDNMKVELTPEQWELRERKLVKVALQHWLDAASSLMNCIALHLPSPRVSQKYRCPLLQTGDLNDEFAKSIMECNPKGPLMMQVSKMIPADKGRFFAQGRVFSGTIASGDKVFIMENYNPDTDKNSLKEHAVTRTVLIMGAKSEPIKDVPCGNTVGLQGIDKFMVKTGTITNNKDAQPLKAMKYTVSPVVRISVRVKDQSNLQKLIDALDKLRKTDPLAIITHTDEGEHIIAGSGELHVEILYNDLCDLAGVDVLKDDPIVSYMETIQAKSCEQCLAKSPNKHNRLLMSAEPMADDLVLKIEKQDIFPSQDIKARAKMLVTEFEWEDDHARKIWSFGPDGTGPNLFVDSTKAIQQLIEIKDHCVSAFQELTKAGPLAFEEQRGVRYSLWDATLHTDSIHRGANQISPATRNGCFASQLSAEPRFQEPIFLAEIAAPQDVMGGVFATLNKRRGNIFDTIEDNNRVVLKGYLPVSESFGFNQDLRANTGGQAFPQCVFDHWEVLAQDPYQVGGKAEKLVLDTRKRKGRKQEVPQYKEYCDKL